MRADHHELPTPRTTLRSRYVRVLVWCKSCRHRRDADLQALVDAGRGDVPLIHLRFRCSNCRSAADWETGAARPQLLAPRAGAREGDMRSDSVAGIRAATDRAAGQRW